MFPANVMRAGWPHAKRAMVEIWSKEVENR